MEAKRNISPYCFYGLIFTIALNCAFPVCGQQSFPGMLKPEEYLPVFRSNDWIYWKSRKPAEYYVVNQTPLKTLPGYDTLYKKSVSTLTPHEKSYAVTWEIVDNQLYLCDIEFEILRGWGGSGIIEDKDRRAMYKKMEEKVYPDGKNTGSWSGSSEPNFRKPGYVPPGSPSRKASSLRSGSTALFY